MFSPYGPQSTILDLSPQMGIKVHNHTPKSINVVKSPQLWNKVHKCGPQSTIMDVSPHGPLFIVDYVQSFQFYTSNIDICQWVSKNKVENEYGKYYKLSLK